MKLPDLVALTRELIDTPSVTGDEAAMARRSGELLQAMGFRVTFQDVAEGRANVLAVPHGKPARVLLITHLDTVPPYFGSRENATHIYGRGACDTKGVLASMLHAGRRLLSDGHAEFGYLLLVGEEVDHCGALAARQLGLSPELCIVGEPTECKLPRGQKGLLKARLTATGVAGHSAYPEVGRSAIHALVRALDGVLGYAWPCSEQFGETTVNVGLISGGVAANVFAPAASAILMVRLACSLAEAEAELRKVVSQASQDVSVEVISGNDPVALITAPGFAGEPVAFNTDIGYLGLPRNMLYGPGSIKLAHSDHESVPKAELTRAVDDYYGLVVAQLVSTHQMLGSE